VERAAPHVVESQAHSAADAPEKTIAVLGMPRLDSGAQGWMEARMEVLRWVFFFALALFLIVYAIFWLAGRPVQLPGF